MDQSPESPEQLGFDEEIQSAARDFSRRGMRVTPLHAQSKRPKLTAWTDVIPRMDEIPRYFSNGANLGIVCGKASDGLIDIDLDKDEARALAHRFLPPTDMVHGRQSAPGSHYWYRSTSPMISEEFNDVDSKPIIEIRSDNHQTLAPPSVHPSGEKLAFQHDGEPACVDDKILRRQVRRLASAALIARHWPEEGSRNDAANAIAGSLLRVGWTDDEVRDFIDAIAECAGDEERQMRVRNVDSTSRRLQSNRPATGIPTLSRIFGAQIVQKICEWIELNSASPTEPPWQNNTTPWPDPLAEEAFYGIAGDVVRAIEPHTEADPAALLIQFLIAFGNEVGRTPHFVVEADKHTTNLFAVMVGLSSKGRKGTSWGRVFAIFQKFDLPWAEHRVMGGLASGEGIIWSVRDPGNLPDQTNKKNGQSEASQADQGVRDKRLCIYEPEFPGVLRVIERPGATVSPVIRQAWDSGSLRVMTKNSPVQATGAHISIIGHATKDEVLRYLTATETGNGFANRFLWVAVKRSRELPDGGTLEPKLMDPLIERVKDAATFAKNVDSVKRDKAARDLWHSVYGKLSDGRPGLFGAVVSRAEAQVVRLSLLYALLDSSAVILEVHLRAALAVWKYAEDSAKFIFGDSLGNSDSDFLLRYLRSNPRGLTRTEIRDLLGRHSKSVDIEKALSVLAENGLAEPTIEETGGRPIERWLAIRHTAIKATKATEAQR